MRKAEWGIIAIVVLSILAAAFFYPQLPPVVASHWDAAGNVNGYMAKGWAVAMFPIILAFLVALFLIIPRIDPRRENIAKFRNYFDYLIVAISLFVYYLFVLMMLWNLGSPFDITAALIPVFALLWWLVGMILPHTESNWFIGIRTPWTISSESVWKRTHEVGGRWFKISAIISLFGVIIPTLAIWFIIVPILATAIGVVVYSYVLYEREKRM